MAAHRVRFHQRDRPFLDSYANGAAIAGLVQPAVGDGLRGSCRHLTSLFCRTTAVTRASAVAIVLLTLRSACRWPRYIRLPDEAAVRGPF